MNHDTPPLVARDPSGPPIVAVVGRISTNKQKKESIDASYRYVEKFLRRIHDGPLNLQFFGEQASGMLAVRETMEQVKKLVAEGRVDLVIAEDLSRIYRNPSLLYSFVQDCADAGVRVIGIGDNLDTASEDWEVLLSTAALRHGIHIPDTRRRVRRSATHSFHRGGMVMKIRYGYRRLNKKQAASGKFGPVGLRIKRRDKCAPIIREMKDRFLRGDLGVDIAEWLNDNNVPAGRYVADRKWSARLVTDFLRAPILAGMRTFRETIYRPIFRTGEHRRERNGEPERHHWPELAHLTPEDHAQILLEIERRRRNHHEDRRAGRRPRNLPRAASYWPGQAVHCGVCGALMHFAGYHHLKCSRSLRGSTRCWNHVQLPVEIMRDRVIGWFSHQLTSDAHLRTTMADAAWESLLASRGTQGGAAEEIALEIQSLERGAENLAQAIQEGVNLKQVVAQAGKLEAALERARQRQQQLRDEDQACGAGVTREELENVLGETLRCMTATSYDFANVLRRVFPRITVELVQALDTPLIRPRVRVLFKPSALLPDDQAGDGAATPPPTTEVVFDLFEPPAHIQHVRACVEAKKANTKLGVRKLAKQLGIGYMTVKRALRYARLMDQAGLKEPYRTVVEQPAKASRWRRRSAG
jgi:DNA invertase Pin-like site-specific DNA recombinase